MPRKKKTETVEVKEVEVTMKEPLEAVLGTGMTRINNELMAKEEEKNE